MQAATIKYECPDRVYKFLSFEGLCKTLENRTIRLSRPSDLNDAHDIYLQECLGKDTKAFLEDLRGDLLDFIESGINLSSFPASPFKAKLSIMIATHRRASQEQRAKLREHMSKMPVEKVYDLKSLEEAERDVLLHVRHAFESDGVFCATVDPKNLLMWAHYANRHHGAVIEFTPNKEKDSALLASRKVIYSKERPVLFPSPSELIRHGLDRDASMRSILNRLIYTKGSDWEYEQEYRLYLPQCIEPGQAFACHEYHLEELTSVFLGCRMNQKDQEKAVASAKAVNPLVEIYRASPAPRKYELNFAECS